MSKHTPGPWHVVAPNGDNMIRVHTPYKTTNEQNVPICTLIADSRESVDSKANARLIAASPMLLEVCKMMLERLEDSKTAKLWESPEEHTLEIEIYRKAIAKATGGDYE